jgi:hypothetical protein
MSLLPGRGMAEFAGVVVGEGCQGVEEFLHCAKTQWLNVHGLHLAAETVIQWSRQWLAGL